MEIKELKERREEKENELRKLQNKINGINLKKIIPKLKKQYEGKFFKYKNSYSCPKKPSDYWFMYIRVEKIINDNSCSVLIFENDKKGKLTFEIRKYYPLNMLQTKITEKEFYREYIKIMKKITEVSK